MSKVSLCMLGLWLRFWCGRRLGRRMLRRCERLLRAYRDHLAAHPAGAANICLEGYEQELEGLPGAYFVMLLAKVDGVAAGCVALRRVRAMSLVVR